MLKLMCKQSAFLQAAKTVGITEYNQVDKISFITRTYISYHSEKEQKQGGNEMKNRPKKQKKDQWQRWVVKGFLLFIGGVCGLLMVPFIEQGADADRSLYEALLTLAGLLFGMYISIFAHMIIHEAGHLVFGLKSGYQFSSFRIGNFMWLKENGKLVHKKLHIAGTGGQCLMIPPEMKDGKIPVIAYNLGGSIMNLIASSAFFCLYLCLPAESAASVLCLIAAIIGVMLALMNGIPMRTGTVDNDGYNALSLGKSKDAMRAFWIQLKVNEQITMGIRLKDMPDEWFAVLADEAMQNSMVATQAVFATNRLMDQQRFEEADQLIAHLLEIDSGIGGLYRSLMICDRVYCELIRENRKEILDKMLTKEQLKFMKAMKKFPSVVRTEYAYALLSVQHKPKAKAILELFEKIAKTYPYPNEIQSERELIQIAQETAENSTDEPDLWAQYDYLSRKNRD